MSPSALPGDVPEVKFVPICDGILFAVVRITSDRWPHVSFPTGDRYILLNYCNEGCCEVELDDKSDICLSSGNLCLSTSKKAASPFTFPGGYYAGIEMSLDISRFRSGEISVLGSSLAPVADIPDRFGLWESVYVSKVTSELRQIFTGIYSSALCGDTLMLKADLARLLLTLAARDMASKGSIRTSYPKSRGRIARDIAGTVSADWSKHYSVAELAELFNLSEGSIKNIFRSVFGQSYSEYLRDGRMRASMIELSETDHSITDVAAHVGYENQSKFAAAFKRFNGVSPLEYRHLHSKRDQSSD